MSAFLCSERHLATIAAWATAHGLADDPVDLCITLRGLNNAALAARYGDAPQALQDLGPALRAAWQEGTRSHPEALALLKCLRYQCAEGTVLEAHPDRAALLGLLDAAEARAPGGVGTPNVWALD